jgi:nucleoside-diphosphate-sugar epimerase
MSGTHPRIMVTGSSGFIGTAMLSHLLDQGMCVQGVDIRPPWNDRHLAHWAPLDLMNRCALEIAIRDFAPTHLIHLAARTDLGHGETVKAFVVNTDGVSGLIDVLNKQSCIEQVIFTSTIIVHAIGSEIQTDDDFCPTTPYGESKAIGEQLVRDRCADSTYTWSIIRPTSIWGPGYGSHYTDFFRLIAKGWYFHPGRIDNHVTYGYLGNCVHQIERLVAAPAQHTHRQVFYIGDYWQTGLKEWAELIHREMGRGRPRVVPDWLLKSTAAVGDLLFKLGWQRVPLTSFRLNNLAQDRRYDTDKIRGIVPHLPYNQQAGVEATIAWLKERGEI